ncbi:MAG: 50S ribosomal protein L15 [Candidatus Nomurabacteria bacterium]|nr:MAG: 50S ribosomal protein L15 [Candidatus Nomurabacteria bacterium]HRV76169.1 50S ribosomal protein L15 [Candidatus Saccharimonadales bacterium]
MKIHELNLTAKKDRKRVGRGISAGGGKTAGRGTKGQKARTGKKLRLNFEGGQTPWIQKVPKNKGFNSKRLRPQVVYTSDLNNFTGSVDNFKLFEAGLITTPYNNVKVIKKGELTKKVELKVQKITAGAQKDLEVAGGKFTFTELTSKNQ